MSLNGLNEPASQVGFPKAMFPCLKPKSTIESEFPLYFWLAHNEAVYPETQQGFYLILYYINTASQNPAD